MYEYITLNDFIKELQDIAERKDKYLNIPYGEFDLLSVGSSCGIIDGKHSPFCINLKDFEADANRTVYASSIKED